MTVVLLDSGGYEIHSLTKQSVFIYNHVLHYFVRLNLFLQHEEPVIAVVYEQVHWEL